MLSSLSDPSPLMLHADLELDSAPAPRPAAHWEPDGPWFQGLDYPAPAGQNQGGGGTLGQPARALDSLEADTGCGKHSAEGGVQQQQQQQQPQRAPTASPTPAPSAPPAQPPTHAATRTGLQQPPGSRQHRGRSSAPHEAAPPPAPPTHTHHQRHSWTAGSDPREAGATTTTTAAATTTPSTLPAGSPQVVARGLQHQQQPPLRHAPEAQPAQQAQQQPAPPLHQQLQATFSLPRGPRRPSLNPAHQLMREALLQLPRISEERHSPSSSHLHPHSSAQTSRLSGKQVEVHQPRTLDGSSSSGSENLFC